MRATILPEAIIMTRSYSNGQYNNQGVYCGLSTATEVFLIFTTWLYQCSCNYDAIAYLEQRGVLQQEYFHPTILPSPHFRWVVNIYLLSQSVPTNGGIQLHVRPCSPTLMQVPALLHGCLTHPSSAKRVGVICCYMILIRHRKQVHT